MKVTRLLISGVVQGVGFRYYTLQAARRLGLRGFVRNLHDGRVEAVASGPPEALQALGDLLRLGPRGARVADVEVSEVETILESPVFEIVG
jgi:acylphosphatase